MATIRPTAAQVVKTGGQEYTWSGFVYVENMTGDNPPGTPTWDEVIIPNALKGRVRPEWVRVSAPLAFAAGVPTPPAAGLDGRAMWELDAALDPQWRIVDDATQGDASLSFSSTITAANGDAWVFVEYGVRHSVPR